jgi:hypothetical protein
MRAQQNTRNRKVACESPSTSSINFFPFENIALKIEENCKIIGMRNSVINQNLEGLTKLFVGRGNPSKLFICPGDKAAWLRSTFINNDPFSFIFRP